MATVYRRGETWYGCFKHRGKKYRPSLNTPNKRLAEQRLRKIITDLEMGIRKKPLGNWKPMGAHFWELSGIEPSSIDQTLTVASKKGGLSRGQPLLERFQKQLEATPGETMGFLREDWKDGRDHKGYDAFIISLHNTLESKHRREPATRGIAFATP